MAIRKILLVDDEPDIRTIGAMSLKSVGGWEVVMASSGLEAVAVAALERPDVVLLDVMMPEMDGPTTFGRLRAVPELSQVPIVFLTAKVQKSEVERYLKLGASGVISKPFDPMTLPSEIRQIVAGG